jgi:hypothetical protein
MIPLSPGAIAARRRPVAIVTVYIAELAWGLLVATPVHAWARHVWGQHPDGDAVLFVPGAHDLMTWLGQTDGALSVSLRTTIVLLAIGAVLMQLPLGMLIASLAFGRESSDPERPRVRALPMQAAFQIGITTFMPLAGLLALGGVVTILLVVIGGVLSAFVSSALAQPFGDARAFMAQVAVLGLFALLAAVLGVIFDLARVAIVRDAGIAGKQGAPSLRIMLRGLGTALIASRRSFGRALLAWTTRAIVFLALLAIGYVASDVYGGRGGAVLVLLFVVHQAIVLGRVALRASWLARALALVIPAQDSRAASLVREDSATPESDEPKRLPSSS